MSANTRDYVQYSLPLLRGPSFIAAARVVIDGSEMEDALAIIWAEAVRLGGAHLPDGALPRLRQWIGERLLRDCDAIQSALDAIEAEAWLDPVRHYDGLSDDPAVRWTFAAISPEYRRALVARMRKGDPARSPSS